MIKTNESLINYKSEEQNQMKAKLEKLNNDTQIQNNKLEKLRKTIREYRNLYKNIFSKNNNNSAYKSNIRQFILYIMILGNIYIWIKMLKREIIFIA